MFLKYPIISSHVYGYSNKSLTPPRWEGNMIMSEIGIENILGFWNRRVGVTLRRLISWGFRVSNLWYRCRCLTCVLIDKWCHLHPKLRNINPHNITHLLISQNPKERMFVVQISLLIVTILSLISQLLSKCKPLKKSTNSLAVHHVSICEASPSCFHATYSMLVHSYATSPGKTKCDEPH